MNETAPTRISARSGARAGAVRQPAHERAYLDLRDRVLFGDLAPGQPVTIQGLAAELGCGMTPVREAIRRLISEGALAFHGNRRVSVPVLTRSDIEDLIFLRKTVETELARRAATAAEEPAVEALIQTDAALDRAIAGGDIRGYLIENHRFHSQINALADAPMLREVSDRLWLRFGPSLRAVCGRLGTQNLPDWHKEIIEALAARDPDAAARAVACDLEQGAFQIIATLDPAPANPAENDSIDTP